MAYFSNGSEGSVFDCNEKGCKYWDKPCPIALIQMNFNYEQLNDKSGTAKNIMDMLISQDGSCSVFDLMKKDLFDNPDQLKLM